VVRCDNAGAMFVVENSSFGTYAKRIHAHYHFVREHDVLGFIKIRFCEIACK
jgi:hypothetical protein